MDHPFRSAKLAYQMDSRGRLSLQFAAHLSARQSGRFVNRPYGTHPRPTKNITLPTATFHTPKVYFTKSPILFHVAIGNISLRYRRHRGISQKRRAAKNAAPDFISRCQRQHLLPRRERDISRRHRRHITHPKGEYHACAAGISLLRSRNIPAYHACKAGISRHINPYIRR